jgi:hypothetical protein
MLRLRRVAVTRRTITVRWRLRRGAQVARFRLLRNGRRVATVKRAKRRFTFTSLRCARAYRLTVQARRGGKTVGRARLRAVTARCGTATQPNGPGGGAPAPGSPSPGSPGGAPPWAPPPTPPPVPDKPASVFLSTSGSDSAACTPSAPCRTFERAYEVAEPGEQVELAAGFYTGQQEIPADADKTSEEDVIFRPAAGASVRLESLDVFGAHVEVRRVSIDRDFYVKCDADDVTLRGSKATLFFIRSASDVTIVDTEFGPSSDISQVGIISGDSQCESAPRNVILDNVYMHDYVNSSTHMECVTLQAFDGLAIRRSRFRRCQDFDVFIKSRAPTVHNRGLLIENTWFDNPAPTGTSAIQFSEPDGGGTYTDVLIRNNAFNGTLTLKPEVGYVNARILSNVGTRWGGPCSAVTSAHNVWSGTDGCTGSDLRAPTGFVDQAGFDYHLRPDAAAIDRGHPSDHPPVDIDGEGRPYGKAPDAGADELR